MGRIDDFTLVMNTDFDDFDFPTDGVSPTSRQATEDGWELTWSYDTLVSGRASVVDVGAARGSLAPACARSTMQRHTLAAISIAGESK